MLSKWELTSGPSILYILTEHHKLYEALKVSSR